MHRGLTYYTAAGCPCHPGPGSRVRPRHYDPVLKRFGPSNHLAVAWTGTEYVLKQSDLFDIWNDDVYDRWVAALTEPQRRQIEAIIGSHGQDIRRIFDKNWTKGDVKSKVEASAREINKLMQDNYDAPAVTKVTHDIFNDVIRHAPEKYGERYDFFGLVQFDTAIDGKAIEYINKATNFSYGTSIGKFVSPEKTYDWELGVKSAVREGKSPDEIASSMVGHVENDIPMNQLHYARGVADQMMAKARSYSEIRSCMDAGFTQVQVMAVLDEVTSDVCRFMHGKIVDAAEAYRIITSSFQYNPADLEKHNPWIRQQGSSLMVGNNQIATVTRSGQGNFNDTGEYETTENAENLDQLNVGLPPYHFFCRSTTVPVFGTRSVPIKNPFSKSPLAESEMVGAAMVAEKNRFDGWMKKNKIKTNDPTKFTRSAVVEYLKDNSKAVMAHHLGGQPWTWTKKDDYKDFNKGEMREIPELLKTYFRGYEHTPVTFDKRYTGWGGAAHIRDLTGTEPDRIAFRPDTWISSEWGRGCVLHEYGHHVSYENKELDRIFRMYWSKKTQGQPVQHHKAGFDFIRDKLLTDYMGKVGGAEVPSVGCETLAQAPFTMYHTTTDLFYLVLAMMRGAI